MRGRNKCGSRLATLLNAGGNIQTFIVDWHGHGIATGQRNDLSCQGVTRLFHPNTIPRIEENPSRNLKRLLGTSDDHDLLSFAVQRSGGFQIVRDRFTERHGSHLIAVTKCMRVRTSAMARDQIGPDAERKLVECHLPYTECSPILQPWEANDTGKGRRAPSDRPRPGRGLEHGCCPLARSTSVGREGNWQ